MPKNADVSNGYPLRNLTPSVHVLAQQLTSNPHLGLVGYCLDNVQYVQLRRVLWPQLISDCLPPGVCSLGSLVISRKSMRSFLIWIFGSPLLSYDAPLFCKSNWVRRKKCQCPLDYFYQLIYQFFNDLDSKHESMGYNTPHSFVEFTIHLEQSQKRWLDCHHLFFISSFLPSGCQSRINVHQCLPAAIPNSHLIRLSPKLGLFQPMIWMDWAIKDGKCNQLAIHFHIKNPIYAALLQLQ